jgi:hypothetical protein
MHACSLLVNCIHNARRSIRPVLFPCSTSRTHGGQTGLSFFPVLHPERTVVNKACPHSLNCIYNARWSIRPVLFPCSTSKTHGDVKPDSCSLLCLLNRVGQIHIMYIYIRCKYGVFGREIVKCTVIYGVKKIRIFIYLYYAYLCVSCRWDASSSVPTPSCTGTVPCSPCLLLCTWGVPTGRCFLCVSCRWDASSSMPTPSCTGEALARTTFSDTHRT